MTRRANRGSFAPGPDPRRRAWTPAEAVAAGRKGWIAALAAHPEMLEWLLARALGAGRKATSEAQNARGRLE